MPIRRRDFTTYTRQRHIEPPTQETRVITAVAAELLDAWLAAQPGAAVRLLGVGVSELAPSSQLDLFTVADTTKNREIDSAVDRIREKFGRLAVTRPARPPRRSPAEVTDPWRTIARAGRPCIHSRSAAIACISTRYAGVASLHATVARAGRASAGTQ